MLYLYESAGLDVEVLFKSSSFYGRLCTPLTQDNDGQTMSAETPIKELIVCSWRTVKDCSQTSQNQQYGSREQKGHPDVPSFPVYSAFRFVLHVCIWQALDSKCIILCHFQWTHILLFVLF